MPSQLREGQVVPKVTQPQTTSLPAQSTDTTMAKLGATIDMEQWTCPLPLRDYPSITMGHGGGGKLSAELVEHLFLPAFANAELAALRDSAVLPLEAGNYAFSTDTYVVQPLFFRGGSIGHLAVHGTINDLAMSGARPLFMSVGLVLEEGFPISSLQRIVADMAISAAKAGVKIVTGDTKVVERGHGDGCYINTSGIGLIPQGIDLGPHRVQPGDAVLISGSMGDHGMAIMSQREGLEFESPITSDTAALHELVASMLNVCPALRMMRDPTRGGVATSLNEIALATKLGIVIDERAFPISPAVRSACEILGLDPLLVANEGKLLAIVPSNDVDQVLASMRQHPLGTEATLLGRIVVEHPGVLTARTQLGAHRVITIPIGEQLPRIC